MNYYFYLDLFFVCFFCLFSIKLFLIMDDLVTWIKEDTLNNQFNLPKPPPIEPLNFDGMNLSKYEKEELDFDEY